MKNANGNGASAVVAEGPRRAYFTRDAALMYSRVLRSVNARFYWEHVVLRDVLANLDNVL